LDAEEALGFAVQAARDAADAAKKAAQAAKEPPSWFEYLEVAPSMFVAALFGIFVVWNWRSLGRIAERVSGVEAFGLKLELSDAKKELGKAVMQEGRVRATVSKEIRITEDDERRAIKRAAAVPDALKDRTLLWIDDMPENNIHERAMFKDFGLTVCYVQTNARAVERIEKEGRKYDVILSDIKRPNSEPDGLALLPDLAQRKIETPVIYYVTDFDLNRSVPAGAFGLTNRPDELVHLVIDALERVRPLR